jgi:GAF domain-containing protein
MLRAPMPEHETERLRALYEYEILDTPRNPMFDNITRLAAQVCEAPIAALTFIDRERQWFKSIWGLTAFAETSREVAFCAHTILGDTLFEVGDSASGFSDNPLAVFDPNVRFYAGMPLRTATGFAVGTLCVIDHQPRALTNAQRRTLEMLAHLTIALLEQRKRGRKLRQAERWSVEQRRRQRLIAELSRGAAADLGSNAPMTQAARLVRETLGWDLPRTRETGATSLP